MESFGIFVEGDKLQCVCLHQNKKSVETKLLKEVEQLLPEELLSQETKIVSGLDGDELVLRKLSLKMRSKHSIRKILPFQAEAALPYPTEETILLPFFTKKSGGESEVSLLATTKSLVHAHLAKLDALRLDPDQVSCAPAALVSFAQHFFPEHPNLVFLHIGRDKSF